MLVVHGDECAGRYIECLTLDTGKHVFHDRLPAVERIYAPRPPPEWDK